MSIISVLWGSFTFYVFFLIIFLIAFLLEIHPSFKLSLSTAGRYGPRRSTSTNKWLQMPLAASSAHFPPLFNSDKNIYKMKKKIKLLRKNWLIELSMGESLVKQLEIHKMLIKERS